MNIPDEVMVATWQTLAERRNLTDGVAFYFDVMEDVIIYGDRATLLPSEEEYADAFKTALEAEIVRRLDACK